MKLFKSSDRLFILNCLDYFGVRLPSVLVPERTAKLNLKLSVSNNMLCKWAIDL